MSNSVIKADNIIKKYGRNYALVGVSVEIEKGRIYDFWAETAQANPLL